MPAADRPMIVITVAEPSASSESEIAERKNNLYADAIVRSGGRPVLIDAAADSATRQSAFAAMDGLLLSGGADIDPARYGRDLDGAREIDHRRDEIEAEAWSAAGDRDVPVLGICRGLQAVNVFAGGTLTQHVDGHAGAQYGHGAPDLHPLRLVPGTRLAALLDGAGFDPDEPVNTFHHQAVRADDLAPGLVAAGCSDSPVGPLVEALESDDGRWLMAVQSHPERQDSTPRAFERLFAEFVAAAQAHAASSARVAVGRTR